jgi:hypothetical protein
MTTMLAATMAVATVAVAIILPALDILERHQNRNSIMVQEFTL